MTDFIKLPYNDGCFTYINLDKVNSIQFDKEKFEIGIMHDMGKLQIVLANIDRFEESKKIIDREMEKRLLP